MEVEDEFMTKLWYAFKRENIKIPYPIREVYNITVKKETEKSDEKSDYEILREIELFFDVDDDLLFKISEKAIKKIYGKDEILFNQGEEGETFFIIKEGSVSVLTNEKEIKILKKGNFFGEISLFTGKKRNATIKVLEDSELLIINRNIFQDILMKNDYLLEKISSIIAKREMENQNIISNTENKNDIKKIHEIKKRSLMSKIKKFFET